MYCTFPSPAECCEPAAGAYSFGAWFCMAICILCCAECTIETNTKRNPYYLARPKKPAKEVVRDFPIIQPATEFSFTTSEYGRFIPIVFGSDKLTGNVFWSSGFDTHFFTVDGEMFYYTTTSFALGICEGEIDALLRLWVGDLLVIDNTMKVDENGLPIPTDDGFILGATIDLTEEDSPLRKIADNQRMTRISVFTGSESQIPEGVMAQNEGYSNTPAYRGLAYILFENFVVSNSTVPAIMAEIAANANPLYPRIYGNLSTPIDHFSTPYGVAMTYDPSFDMFTIAARDTLGTGAVPNGAGYATFSGNNMDKLGEYEVAQTQGMQWIDQSGNYRLSTGKQLILPVNFGIAQIFNPFSGQLEEQWGPPQLGPGSVNVIGPDGIPSYREGCCTFVWNPPGKPPMDILFATSFVNFNAARAFGIVSIDDRNKFTLLYNSGNNFYGKGPNGRHRAFPVYIDDVFAAETPSFVDGTPSMGMHVLVTETALGEKESINFYRVTVSNTGSLTAPNAAKIAEISCADIGGVGYDHAISHAFVDPADNCLVCLCTVTGSGRADRIFKFSPFTGQLVWISACNVRPTTFNHGHEQQLIVGPKYAFMSSTGRVQMVDLRDGQIETIITTLGNQQLPTPIETGEYHMPYYNGLENSLTYISSDQSRRLVKVFLERTDRTTVPVSDIVMYLFERVGVSRYELDASDLSALTLRGYTINNVKSLRSVFAELSQVFTFDIVESNGKIIYKSRGANSLVTIPNSHLAPTEDGYLTESHENEFGRTRKINLTYRDIDREYGQNVQSVFLPKYNNASFDDDMAIDVNVPVVLDADTAKRLAEILLYAKIIGEQTYQGVLRPGYSYLDPGDVITILTEDGPSEMRLRQVERGNDRSIGFRATKEDPDIYNDQVNLFGNLGRFDESQITPMDPRVDPFVIDIPFRNDEEAASTTSSYLIFMTMLNNRVSTPPTRDMHVLVDGTGGSAELNLPPPLTFPTWGYTLNALPYRPSFYSTDYDNVLMVKMMSDSGAPLGTVSKEDLLTLGVTCNLAYVGGELVQFEAAVNEGNDVWSFHNLQRCRLGTEFRSFNHKIGERFILLGGPDGILDDNSIMKADVSKTLGQRTALHITLNNNNPFQPSPIVYNTALNLRPWSVSSFKTEHNGNDLKLSWRRRSRFDGQYADDGQETYALHEAPETYQFYLYTDQRAFRFDDPTTYLRAASLTSPEYIYTDAMATEDGIDITNDQLYCLVSQNGAAAGLDEGAAMQFKVTRKAT